MLLETGVFATIEEIAAAEKINASHVGRVLQFLIGTADDRGDSRGSPVDGDEAGGNDTAVRGGKGRSKVRLVSQADWKGVIAEIGDVVLGPV